MAAYHRVWELSPAITGWTISVFVVRVFKKFVGPNVFQLGLVLADEWGTSIEATISPPLAEFYYGRIKENQWKTITRFSVRPNTGPLRVTKHAYSIWFMHETVVCSAEEREPVLFNNLTPFDYILENTADTTVMVDVVGALVDVGDLTNDNDGYQIQFVLKDHHKEVLKCQAFGQNALDFNSLYRNDGRSELVIALSLWKIVRRGPRRFVMLQSNGPMSKVFIEPNIPEVAEIKMVVF